jgi:hypothetical protein
MDSRLRIGLLLDSVFLPAWAYTAIKRIICSNYAELVLIVLNQSQPKKDSVLLRLWQDPNHWLYHVFNAIDEKLFLRNPNALAHVDASKIFSNVPILGVEPVDKNGQQQFSASAVAQTKSYQLDILVKLGFGNLHGDVLLAANYGIWTYRWGDPRNLEDGLTGFWEVVERSPETGAALQQLGVDAEHNKTLFESWFFTYPYSPARSRNYILWAATSFLPRQIEHLYRLGREKYFQEKEKNKTAEIPTSLKSNVLPSNRMTLWIMMKLTIRNLVEVYRRSFYREHWELLFNFGSDTEKDISAFNKISPPKDRFWADPHVVYKAHNYYVFVEEYLYQTKKGHISVIEMDRKGNYQQSIPILQRDYHLSFPFVFDWMDHYYMIPESSEKRTIDLYECINFPYQWQHKITLMKNVKAVDTILLYRQGKWWLFTAMAEQEEAAPQVELFLFYSDKLFTDRWHAHPRNPIVSDVKRARGAGSIFLKDGRLFRPSQDCSKTYGYGFDLNEIVTLSETEYYERTVTSVRPDPKNKIIATHTYANQGDLIVVDALTLQPKWAKSG